MEAVTAATEFSDAEFSDAKRTIMEVLSEQEVRALAVAQFVQLKFHEKYGNAMNNAYDALKEQPCNALGEPEDHIELRCCLPQGHEGPHSFVVFPHAGVAMPDSSALIDAAFKHSDLYEGREIPANETRSAINNAFFAGAQFATPWRGTVSRK